MANCAGAQLVGSWTARSCACLPPSVLEPNTLLHLHLLRRLAPAPPALQAQRAEHVGPLLARRRCRGCAGPPIQRLTRQVAQEGQQPGGACGRWWQQSLAGDTCTMKASTPGRPSLAHCGVWLVGPCLPLCAPPTCSLARAASPQEEAHSPGPTPEALSEMLAKHAEKQKRLREKAAAQAAERSPVPPASSQGAPAASWLVCGV